jgi:hypothetical protein
VSDRYRVTVTEIALRSAPVVKPRNRVAALAYGAIVEKIEDAHVRGWWRVRTADQPDSIEGFVNSKFLELIEQEI